MSRETYAAMHLRRFANAVSIAMAVPRGRQRDAQTLRSLFESLGKSYESARSAKHLGALAATKSEPSPLTSARVSYVEPVAPTPVIPPVVPPPAVSAGPAMVPVTTKAVPEAVLNKLSEISGSTAATNFFAATPWSLRKTEGKSPMPADVSTIESRHHATAVVDSASEESTATSFFRTLSWQGSASSKVVSIQPSPAIAESERARFGILPGGTTSDTKAQSVDFFRDVPWNRAEQK
jgi:hypothetical protein